MIKVTVFDVDDTMFPERFVRIGFQAVGDWILNKYAVPRFFELAWKFFGQGNRGKIFNLVLAEIGIEDDLQIIQQSLQIYREHKP